MPTPLSAGMKAPLFAGLDQDGNKVSLTQFRGKKLVLYFYPDDDTPTCTVQACNLRDHYGDLVKAGYHIIGVSPNEMKDHRKFRDKYNLPFPLLSDPTHTIINRYGVWGEKKLYGRTYMGLHRTTFVIDEKGIIREIILRPRNKHHAQEILKTDVPNDEKSV